jgi:hypothetical protein
MKVHRDGMTTNLHITHSGFPVRKNPLPYYYKGLLNTGNPLSPDSILKLFVNYFFQCCLGPQQTKPSQLSGARHFPNSANAELKETSKAFSIRLHSRRWEFE